MSRRSLTWPAKRALSLLLPSAFRISIGFPSSPTAKARRAPHLDPPSKSSKSWVILTGFNAATHKSQISNSHAQEEKEEEDTNGQDSVCLAGHVVVFARLYCYDGHMWRLYAP